MRHKLLGILVYLKMAYVKSGESSVILRTLIEKWCIENASFLDSFVTQELLKEYNKISLTVLRYRAICCLQIFLL